MIPMDEYSPDFIEVIDEDGNKIEFEIVDRFTEEGSEYVALIDAAIEDDEDDEDELIILRSSEEDGEFYLEPVEDEELLDRLWDIFKERQQDNFNFN